MLPLYRLADLVAKAMKCIALGNPATDGRKKAARESHLLSP